jgi:hypothetical protein
LLIKQKSQTIVGLALSDSSVGIERQPVKIVAIAFIMD